METSVQNVISLRTKYASGECCHTEWFLTHESTNTMSDNTDDTHGMFKRQSDDCDSQCESGASCVEATFHARCFPGAPSRRRSRGWDKTAWWPNSLKGQKTNSCEGGETVAPARATGWEIQLSRRSFLASGEDLAPSRLAALPACCPVGGVPASPGHWDPDRHSD